MPGNVYALAVDEQGNLYAGGYFTTAGGVVANNIARWDGATWYPLGEGMNNSVYALALDGQGDLYAGGGFTTAGGVGANHIARWDGEAWYPLGEGMNNNVYSLAVDGQGNLYAGGSSPQPVGFPPITLPAGMGQPGTRWGRGWMAVFTHWH